ncbi:MAG: orotidine-5'-phosphate decarboxylase [Alphaproteobacteria bacterium]|nr:orotidine-5'-phosphate decarboxylase [Alphaproteobacteria bacterium]
MSSKPIPRGIWCALDLPDDAAALAMVAAIKDSVVGFKIGMELFYRYGPELVARVARAAGESKGIFLDLKLHDIPNTVRAAARSLSRLDFDLLTVHAVGGPEMVAAAADGIGHGARIIAVTVLTSLDDASLAELGYHEPLAKLTRRLAGLALKAGAAGLVCSGLEVTLLREQFGAEPILVVPGLRMATEELNSDQRRIVTPAAARESGGDVLVVGRPITAAPNPAAAAKIITESLN